MVEYLKDVYENIVAFDLIYIIITLLSLIKCSRKGFILSLLAAAKWLLAYVITLILFPRVKSYVGDIIDNEYVLDIVLGIGIFVIVIFLILPVVMWIQFRLAPNTHLPFFEVTEKDVGNFIIFGLHL